MKIPDINVLVKFDKQYAFGNGEEQFKLLCKQAFDVPDFFTASVSIGEYGDKENDDLRSQLKIQTSDLPHIRLYRNQEPIIYNGSKTDVGPMVLFLRRNGINIQPVGGLPEFEDIVKEFVNADAPSTWKDILEKTKKITVKDTSMAKETTKIAEVKQKSMGVKQRALSIFLAYQMGVGCEG